MNWDNQLPLLMILSVLLPGLVIFTLDESRRKLRTVLNLLAAFSCIGYISVMLAGVYQGEVYETRLPLLPDMDLVLHADALSLLFVTLSGVLWLLTTIYAIGYLEDSPNRSRFFGFFSLCVATTIGIALAGNLITFLIFYELLTLATYPLVVHKGNEASLDAGRKYLQYTMAGGALLLAGVVWLRAIAGPLEFTANGVLASLPGLDPFHLQLIFGLIIAGLGVKAALVPLHGWLPSAMAAPAPVSSLLHAVAVVKAGAFGIVRVVYDVYGIEFSQTLGLTLILAVLASITIIYGSLRALFQDDLKKRLAYSTVSQVSYIALGTAIAGPIATIGGIAHLVHQGVMKITMFFCAGNLAVTLGVHKVSQLDGAGKRMPLTMAAFSLAALGMIGIPPAAGFVSKWYLGTGTLEAEFYWVIGVLAISSLLNAMYFLPILYAAWFKPQTQDWPKEQPRRRLETHWMLLFPPVITAAIALIVGVFADHSLSPLNWATLIAVREYGGQFVAIVNQSSTGLPYLWWVVLTPLLLIPVLWVKKATSGHLGLLVVATIPAISFVLSGALGENHLPWLFFGSVMAIDETSRVLLLLAGLLWFGAGFYAMGYMHNDVKRRRFVLFSLLAMSGNFGLILAQDLFGFITFFTLMSLASYGLIVHNATAAALQAGKTYIQWVVLGEIVLFAGFAGLAYSSGLDNSELNIAAQPAWVTVLLLVGFAVKAGVFGLHMWLPRAHPVAPLPASALLSGIMVKAGLLGWLNFVPLGIVAFESLGQAVVIFGLVGAFFGVAVGLTQRNAKALLAYSTLSQMGIITAAVGAGLTEPQLWPLLLPAILLYAVHHGVAKATLFLSVGIAPLLAERKYRVWVYAGIILPALVMAGLPLTSGALAKTGLKHALGDGVIAFWLPITAIGTSWLMLRFIQLLGQSTESEKAQTQPARMTVMAYVLMLALALSLVWALPQAALFNEKVFTLEAVWQSLWPYLLGFGLFALSNRYYDRIPLVPPGDFQVLCENLVAWAKSQVKPEVPNLFKVSKRDGKISFNPWRISRPDTDTIVTAIAHPGVIFILILLAIAVVSNP